MKSILLALAVSQGLCSLLIAQELKGSPRDVAAGEQALKTWWTDADKTREQRLAWWREARFGCFIHWGVYADPAGEFHGKRSGSYSEHIMRSNKIPLKTYKEEIVANFNPTKFNADEWADLFENAGMKYVVITAKHHDGFAMYPSDAYPYDIRLTKFKDRDPMRKLSEACRKRGIRFGFYYSHAFDWEHPDAPGNDWDYDQPGGDKKLHGAERWYDEHPELLERAKNYVDKKAIPQLQELIKNYHPDLLWFDTSGKLPFSEQIRIVAGCRAADPNVIINGRAAHGLGKNWGDYTNTGDNPAEVRGADGDWESIPTVNSSYGYHRFDKNFKTPEFFIQLIAKVAAKGGNVLLNIGPMGNGEIDPDSQRILRGIGNWMATAGESIYGTTRTPLDRQAWGDSTLKGDALYLHVFQWPTNGKLTVGGLRSDVASAQMLNGQGKLTVEHPIAQDVVVTVPAQMAPSPDHVIKLNLKGKLETIPGYLLATNVPVNRLLAFDADASDKGVKYGDGKAARYYVNNFDALTWNARLNAPATFRVSIKYSLAGKDAHATLTVADQKFSVPLKATRSATDLNDADVGEVKFNAGEVPIRLEVNAADKEQVNIFELQLR